MIPTVFAFSEAGGDTANEDSFGVREHPDDETCLVCALADGQGGQAGSARAAQVATRTTLEAATGYPSKTILLPNYWGNILRQADEAVRKDDEAGFTTLIGLSIGTNKVCGASSGDSAVLVMDGKGRVQELTQQQIKNPPVGAGGAFFIPFATTLTSPWLVLVMSDGVWKYVGWGRIREAASQVRGQALLDALQQHGRMRGSRKFQDDFTVLVIQDKD